MSPPTRRGRAALLVALALFVVLGLPEGVLGASWPSMRADLGRPVSSLAWLFGAYTAGYLASTSLGGAMFAGRTVDMALRWGAGATAVGLVGQAVAPVWWFAIAAAGVVGAGAGTVDSTLNAYVALTGGPRAMNLLHGFFGIGATLGPVLVTVVALADASWRLAYAAVGVAALSLFLVVWRLRHQFRLPVSGAASDDYDPRRRRPATRPPVSVIAPVLVFFCFYVGVEASYGQWSYSLLVDERGVSDTMAGVALAFYWGGLTVGRFALAGLGGRVDPTRILHWSFVGLILAGAVFWVGAGQAVDLMALAALGLSAAGVFPAMVLLTPRWLGADATESVVGWQLAASSIGVIATSAGIGAAVRVTDLEAMPPIILGLTVVCAAMFVLAERAAGAGSGQVAGPAPR